MADLNPNAQGTVVKQSNHVPQALRYIEFKCGFKDRNEQPACNRTTGLLTRTHADKLLSEHWNAEHEVEYKKILNEKEIEREKELYEETKKQREVEHREELEREEALSSVLSASESPESEESPVDCPSPKSCSTPD